MQNQPASPASPEGPILNEAEGLALSEVEGPVQGGGYNAPARSSKNFIFRHKQPIGILIVLGVFLFALALTAVLIFFKKPGPDIAAKIGDQEIKVADVENFATDCNVDKKEAVEYLVDDIVLAKWANDEKINASPQEQQFPEEGVENVQLRPCEITLAKTNLLREKLSQNAVGYREGKFIVVSFDRFSPNPFLPPPEATQGADLAELQKKERAYADNLIQSINNDLKSKKLTFEEAVEKVQKDPNVGLESGYGAAIQGGPFSAVDYIEKRGLLRFDEVRQKVDGLKENEFSEPFIQKVDVSLEEGKPQLIDGRWIIAKVDKIGKGGEKAEDILVNTRDKYDAKIYLK